MARPGRERGAAQRTFDAWGRVIERRLAWFAVAAVVATVVLAGGLGKLRFDSSQSTIVPPGSAVARDNLQYQSSFGGEVMIVLFDGDVRSLLTPANRRALDALETDLRGTGRFHAVIGPDTDIAFAAKQLEIAGPLAGAALQRDLAAAPTPADRDRISAAFQARAAADGARLAAVGDRSLDNPLFVDFLLFDEHGEVRPSQRGAFPDDQHALLLVRLAGNLSLDEQSAAVGDVVRLVAAHPIEGHTAMATGSAALVREVNDRMRADMARTGLVGLGAMAVVLLLVLRARWRLLALPVVAVSMVWVFGALGYLGIPLSLVTISGLPILVGLGVDFAVQVHARHEEESRRDGVTSPLRAALAGIGPALLVALVAAATGFLALRLSPVPMVQDFAVLLTVGVGVLLLAVLAFVPAALALLDRRAAPAPRTPRRERGLERLVHGLVGATRLPPPIAAGLAVVIAVAGLAVQGRIPVESDPERFVATSSPVLHDLERLREVARTSSDIGFIVEADDIMRPDVLRWMAAYEQLELDRHRDVLVLSSSIATITGQVTGSVPTPDDVRAVLALAPPDLRDTFVAAGGQRTQVLFSVGRLTLAGQRTLLEQMQADLAPPPGVRIAPAGLAVVGMEAVRYLEQGRTSMTLAAIGFVALWLLVAFRRPRTVIVALLPVLTAVGASLLAIRFLGVTVSMLGALSSPLVIAIGTEFSVLLIERVEEEQARGLSRQAAIDAAAASIGRAFTTSGLTIASGFGALALSGFPLLSSFGAVVAVNVVAAMLCALVLLPPLLTALPAPARASAIGTGGGPLGEQTLRRPARLPDQGGRAITTRRPRLR